MCVLDETIWPPEFSAAAARAYRHAIADLGHKSPVLAEQMANWLSLRCDVSHPEDYFIRPQSLPILALPWWLENTIRGEVDIEFQIDLMYSSISGYLFARILDDVMDGHELDRAALPALYPLNMQFLTTYFKYFEYSDPFWRELEKRLMITAEAAAVETRLNDIHEVEFKNISARKTAAGVIPMAAVCYRYRRPDLFPAWNELFTALARWHQMRDDLLDWSLDYTSTSNTWLLSEAKRRRAVGESVPEWMGREGFKRTRSIMEAWINGAIAIANGLGSPELQRYLALRKASFASYIDTLIDTAAAFGKLLQLEHSSLV